MRISNERPLRVFASNTKGASATDFELNYFTDPATVARSSQYKSISIRGGSNGYSVTNSAIFIRTNTEPAPTATYINGVKEDEAAGKIFWVPFSVTSSVTWYLLAANPGDLIVLTYSH